MTQGMFDDLVAALDRGIRPEDDTRVMVVTELLGWDGDSNRGLVSLDGGDRTWLFAAADTYWPDVVGAKVIVLRNTWTGKGAVILGPVGSFQEPDDQSNALPGRAQVVAVGSGYVRVIAGDEQYNATTVLSYANPTPGDKVALVWDDGVPIAVAEVGTWTPSRPSTPPRPRLNRSGSKVTVSWSKPSTVDTTRVRYRYSGGSWTERTGYTGTSMSLSIAAGRSREVQIAQKNAGGLSGWSGISSIDGPTSTSAPGTGGGSARYETVTKTISPTSTGTYRQSVNRWDDWNRGRYGFPYSLYQGSKYGSGSLVGLATYGSRIKDLRATEILYIEVRLVDANIGEYRVGNPIRIRPSKHGSRPGGDPSVEGSSTTTNLGKGKSKWVRLDIGNNALEGFRTGALRGLVINGSAYRAVKGKGTSGMSVRVRYRRRA